MTRVVESGNGHALVLDRRSEYVEFLAGKEPQVVPVGIDAPTLNAALKAWQADVVRWALRLGRAALFEDCGLGKTLQQLEWAHRVCEHASGNVLILAPLAVTAQTVREGERFGIPVRYCRSQAEVQPGITITNYDCLDAFDAESFVGVVLDESSILKAFSGKTKRALIEKFNLTPFRLACTATPAPNDVIELGNHAEFLGLMESSEMLTRWFINDTMAAGNYRLKGYAEADFWRWCATWAACLARPSDLCDPNGQPYSDEGYQLPDLELIEQLVEASGAPPKEGELFHDPRLSATTLHKEMRLTIPQRVARAAALVAAEPSEAWVIWCNTNDEADALQTALPDAIEVRGSDTPSAKEEKLTAFSEGRARIIITKPSIAGFGLNWQHCARHIYCGLSYSFEQFYQALRRSYRFGQRRAMKAFVIVSKSETGIRAVVQRKQAEHLVMQSKMAEAMRAVKITDQQELLSAKVGQGVIGVAKDRGGWEVHHGDCVEVTARLPADSMHLSVFSPPFAGLYTYSASLRDMGNSEDDAEFYKHFAYLVPELLRITVPGRLCVVHTKDLPAYKNTSGASGLRDLSGELTRVFEGYTAPDGSRWVYHSKVTIWKCPVTEMQRTKSHGLLYKTLKRDASFSRQGCPDYLTVYRKWTPGIDSAVPVEHTEEDLPLLMWQRYASPVWMDIDQTDVLNVRVARANQDEKHICPLQLGVIERCVHLWTNPGEVVFSPFAGIGSEGVVSVKAGRRFCGVELKREYFEQAKRNIGEVAAQLGLFGGR